MAQFDVKSALEELKEPLADLTVEHALSREGSVLLAVERGGVILEEDRDLARRVRFDAFGLSFVGERH